MAEGLLERTWGARVRSPRRTVVGFVAYMVTGVLAALLAVWGSDGLRQIAWTLVAVLNFSLGISLAVCTHRRRQHRPPPA